MFHTNRAGSRLRRSLGLLSAGALTLALAPAAVAGAQVPGTGTTETPEARGIDEVCEGPYSDSFLDVAADQAHAEAILCALEYGITTGTSDPDLYNPGGTVNRAQMASFIVRTVELATAHELPAHDADFDDVPETSRHAENINKLAGVGITQGTSDDTYSPSNPVTRGQMASFIARAIDYVDDAELNGSLPESTDDDYFADDDGTAHEDNINLVASVGIVQGFPDGDYRPGANIRRDQMASFLMRSLDFIEAEGYFREAGTYVTNLDTNETYDTLSEALAAAAPDEHLEAQGEFEETANVTVDGVHVHATPFGPAWLDGSFVVDADDVMIAGFALTGYTATDNAGIRIDGGKDIVIADNWFYGVDGTPPAATLNGISIAPGTTSVVDIVGNVFENHNIGIYANSGDVTIEGNLFTGNNFNVGLDTATWTVTDNEFEDANETGVDIFQFGLGSTILGNTFGADHEAYVCTTPANPALLTLAAAGNSYEVGPQPNGDGSCLVPPAGDGS